MEEVQVQYWDVFPKSIKVSQAPVAVSVPLSVRGTPRGTVQFDSANLAIASVDENGIVSLGVNVGATMLSVFDSEDRTSARYVSVEIMSVSEVAVV